MNEENTYIFVVYVDKYNSIHIEGYMGNRIYVGIPMTEAVKQYVAESKAKDISTIPY